MILTIGDSVCWGQGLAEAHKFDCLYAKAKALPFTRIAHSGAIIGAKTDSSPEVEDSEVPVGPPTVWQQVLAARDWSQIDLVLLNGGINDVSVTRILSPWTNTTQLKHWIDQFCNQAMAALLTTAAGQLTAPGARIAVLGYYPILSSQSGGSETQMRSLLEVYGVATSSVIAQNQFSFSALIPTIVNNCITFWNYSNAALQIAVNTANAAVKKNVCAFVPLPFTEANSMWAPQSLLWELNALLLPEDEVSGPREKACEALYGDVVHIPQWIQCARASAGHPDVKGAQAIADALVAAL